MSDLVVIVYSSEEKAEEVRKRLFELQGEYLIKMGDAVIATKDEKGRVKLNQVMNMTAAGAAAEVSGVCSLACYSLIRWLGSPRAPLRERSAGR